LTAKPRRPWAGAPHRSSAWIPNEGESAPCWSWRPPLRAPAGNFTWTGNGANDSFTESCNWYDLPCDGEYASPSSTFDDATVPYNASGWTIVLSSLTINSLTIESSVDFTGSATLTLDAKLYIDADSGDIEITFGASSEITTIQ
jgi:hypothetical protein